MIRTSAILLFSLLIGSFAFAEADTDETAEPAQDTHAVSVDVRKCVGGHCDRNVTSQPNFNYSPKHDGATVQSDLGNGRANGDGPAGSSK